MMKENNEEPSFQDMQANHAEPDTTAFNEKNEVNGKEKAVNNLSGASEENVPGKIAAKKKTKKNIEKKSSEEAVEPKLKSKKSSAKTVSKKNIIPPVQSTPPPPKKTTRKKTAEV